jgi:hypothetical protein
MFSNFSPVCGEGKEKKDFTKKLKRKRSAESELEDVVDELRLLKIECFLG